MAVSANSADTMSAEGGNKDDGEITFSSEEEQQQAILAASVPSESSDAKGVKRACDGTELDTASLGIKVPKLKKDCTGNKQEFIVCVEEGHEMDGVQDAEREVLALADAAANTGSRFSEEVVVQESSELTDASQDEQPTVLGDFTAISENGPAEVQIVVEQDPPNDLPSKSSETAVQTNEENQQTSTATVAAPHGINPSIMSNLLHTAAAVAASQNAAAATVQVIPGQPAGTIQLVQESDVQRTQAMMAAGVAPQSIGQNGEDTLKPNQTVFTYLVTSQGTLIAAHSSDGTELISNSASQPKSTRKGGSGKRRQSKGGKPVKEEGDENGDNGKCLPISNSTVFCLAQHFSIASQENMLIGRLFFVMQHGKQWPITPLRFANEW